MKTHLTKAVALLLVLLMALSGVAVADSLPEITVLMFCYTDPADKQLVVDAANAILAETVEVRIKSLELVNSSNYKNQLTLMLASQEPIDAYFESYAGRSDYFGHIDDGLLYPMGDLLAEYGQGIVDSLGMENIYGAAVEGEIYGVPGVHEWAVIPSVIMRTDLVEKYGVDIGAIKNSADLTAILKTLKENEPDVYPMFTETNVRNASFLVWLGGGTGNVEHFADDYGVLLDATTDSLELVNLFATEEYRKGLEVLHSWYNAGYIYPDVLTASDQRTALFQAGKVFCMNTSYKPGMENQLGSQFGYAMTSFTPETAKPISLTSVMYSNFWSIPYYCKQPDAAMRFINELYTNSALATMFSAGVEGTHYVKNENGTISYAEGLSSTTTGYPMAATAWAWGNQLIGPIWSGDSPDLYIKLKEFNDTAVKSPALGFTFDTSALSAEVAAVANVITEYQKGLELGVADPADTLDAFLNKLDAAGMQTLIAEKQAQLDRWAAAK